MTPEIATALVLNLPELLLYCILVTGGSACYWRGITSPITYNYTAMTIITHIFRVRNIQSASAWSIFARLLPLYVLATVAYTALTVEHWYTHPLFSWLVPLAALYTPFGGWLGWHIHRWIDKQPVAAQSRLDRYMAIWMTWLSRAMVVNLALMAVVWLIPELLSNINILANVAIMPIAATLVATKRTSKEQIAYNLLSMFHHKPDKAVCSVMSTRLPDSPNYKKYVDVKNHHFSYADMLDHLEAKRTWALTLAYQGMAKAGCRDYDEGGEERAQEALRVANSLGLTAFAIVIKDRSHVWLMYQRPAPEPDIRAQLAELPAGAGEIYPQGGNKIRLPWGLHRQEHTRGTMLLQDGRSFDLDNDQQLVDSLAVVQALRRNAPPPKAEGRIVAAGKMSMVAVTNPADWEGIDKPQGGVLMGGARYRTIFARRPQLRQLAAGERVTIRTLEGERDTGSELVAVLISNLITTGRADEHGSFVPGLGAPPLSEIRAIALWWHETLRPGYELSRYQADVDRLIAKYMPAGYQPEATRGVSTHTYKLPELPESRRGRPRGIPSAMLDRIRDVLHDGMEFTRQTLGRAVGAGERSISRYLDALRADGVLETERHARGYRVTRLEKRSAKYSDDSQKVICHITGFEASQSGEICMEEHTPPLVPPSGQVPVPVGWVPVAEGQVLEPGCQVRMSLETGAVLVAEPAGNVTALDAHPAAESQSRPAMNLVNLVAEALRSIPRQIVTADGELRRVRVDASLLRAWLAERYTGRDTTEIESILPAVRRMVRSQDAVSALRDQADALDNRGLLAHCRALARALARSQESRRGYHRLAFVVADELRRRRAGELDARRAAESAADRVIQFAGITGGETMAELWALVDQVRSITPIAPSARPRVTLAPTGQPPTSPRGGVCSSLPESPNAGMIQRLLDLRDSRLATASG